MSTYEIDFWVPRHFHYILIISNHLGNIGTIGNPSLPPWVLIQINKSGINMRNFYDVKCHWHKGNIDICELHQENDWYWINSIEFQLISTEMSTCQKILPRHFHYIQHHHSLGEHRSHWISIFTYLCFKTNKLSTQLNFTHPGVDRKSNKSGIIVWNVMDIREDFSLWQIAIYWRVQLYNYNWQHLSHLLVLNSTYAMYAQYNFYANSMQLWFPATNPIHVKIFLVQIYICWRDQSNPIFMHRKNRSPYGQL